jgi:cyclophilin family peptidyl-prolyl cis-trans isomerase
MWNKGKQAEVYKELENIPSEEELAYMAALIQLNSIEWNRVLPRMKEYYRSDNQQVLSLIGEYFEKRILRVDENEFPVLLKDFEAFTRALSLPSLQVEFLFMIAHSVNLNSSIKGGGQETWVNLYKDYIDEPFTAAACLVLLGYEQDAVYHPLFKEALQHSDPFVVAAAKGALSLYDVPTLDIVLKYKMAFNPTLPYDWGFLKKYGRHPRITLHTNKGDIVVELDVEQTPLAAQNLIYFTENNLFDNISFYRFVPYFVTQTGGFGQYGRCSGAEFSHMLMDMHVVNAGGPSPNSMSQHFIISSRYRPERERGGPTVGYVVDGHDVCDNLARFDIVETTTVSPGIN